MEERGTTAPVLESDSGCALRGLAPCLDSAHAINEKPTTFPHDFPQRLKRFQEESGLSWAEIARRLGTYRYTVWRRKEGKALPNTKYMMALLGLADELDLAHLFTD